MAADPSAAPLALGPPSSRPGGAGRRALERLLGQGADACSDVELLAVLLDRGRDDAPAELLRRYGTLRRLACASPQELFASGGAAPRAAARLAAAFALGRRATAGRWEKGEPFRASRDIFERYHAHLRDARKERFIAVLLDGKNRVLRDERVSEGSLTSSLVHPREVFAPAIRESASAMVFVHNHPSGDPEPSPEDLEITRRLCAVGELVGIPVLDHVVIGDGAFVSFLDRGLLPAF
jgi:DNA repair protein RadC